MVKHDRLKLITAWVPPLTMIATVLFAAWDHVRFDARLSESETHLNSAQAALAEVQSEAAKRLTILEIDLAETRDVLTDTTRSHLEQIALILNDRKLRDFLGDDALTKLKAALDIDLKRVESHRWLDDELATVVEALRRSEAFQENSQPPTGLDASTSVALPHPSVEVSDQQVASVMTVLSPDVCEVILSYKDARGLNHRVDSWTMPHETPAERSRRNVSLASALVRDFPLAPNQTTTPPIVSPDPSNGSLELRAGSSIYNTSWNAGGITVSANTVAIGGEFVNECVSRHKSTVDGLVEVLPISPAKEVK